MSLRLLLTRFTGFSATKTSTGKRSFIGSTTSCNSNTIKGVAVIVGAGDSTGAAITRRFAKAGYIVCPVRRNLEKLSPLVQSIENEYPNKRRIYPFGVDCRKEENVVDLISHIEDTIGPIEVGVFNIGANVNYNLQDTTATKYFKVWEMATLSGFYTVREVTKYMLERSAKTTNATNNNNIGTFLFTGATASIRGNKGFCAFGGAKHALRALAQSSAKELWPQGIHIGHVIIDGAINTPWVHENFPNDAKKKQESDGLLLPDSIAEAYYFLHQQPRNAWTFEMDLRPWNETW